MFKDNDGEQQETGPPVQLGSLIRIKMLGRGSKGDFFGKLNGFVIFVGNAKDTDLDMFIDVEVTEVKPKCAFGKKI